MAETGKRFEMRVEEDLLRRVDRWRAEQDELPTRSEAMRRLIEQGLQRAGQLLSPGEKLILLALRQMGDHLDAPMDDPDLELVADVIHRGQDWVLGVSMPGVFHGHQDKPENVELVNRILAMWEEIEHSYEQLSTAEKTAIATAVDGPMGRNPQFFGFDGNGESELMGIAGTLIRRLDRFPRFGKRALNAHMPTLAMHRRMLAAYEQLDEHALGRNRLSRDELAAVLLAATSHR